MSLAYSPRRVSKRSRIRGGRRASANRPRGTPSASLGPRRFAALSPRHGRWPTHPDAAAASVAAKPCPHRTRRRLTLSVVRCWTPGHADASDFLQHHGDRLVGARATFNPTVPCEQPRPNGVSRMADGRAHAHRRRRARRRDDVTGDPAYVLVHPALPRQRGPGPAGSERRAGGQRGQRLDIGSA